MRVNYYELQIRVFSRPTAALLIFLALSICTYPTHTAELNEYSDSSAPPPLELPQLHGDSRSLADFKDRVVMVNFWASWCHPCIQEIPGMMRLAERLADRPFTILAVNVGEEPVELPGFVHRMQERMIVLLDPEQASFKAWGAVALPTTFIIDRRGRIRYEAYGPVNWDESATIDILTVLLTETTVKAD